jgi:hypothetical protein
LLKEEEARPAVLLRKKTSENKSGARIEYAAVSMHHIYTFWHPFPKAHSIMLSTERDKNSVDYLPSLILCGQERWTAIGKDSKMSFTN